MLRKLPVRKEPKLHAHRYIVTVNTRVISKDKKSSHVRTRFHYCVNLKEVMAICKGMKKGQWSEVFSAFHNYIQGYAQE